MDDMDLAEMFKEVVEENRTRKILDLLNQCNDLEEAKDKIQNLLK